MSPVFTFSVIAVFLAALLAISYYARRSGRGALASAENYLVGGRALGTGILLLSMGATYFSTWTLLGAFGAYYRSGVWFAGFTVWTICHGLFVWMFGVRIWLAGKRYGFVTPGQMIEDYYRSKRLRIAVSVVGVTSLLPVMLIQVAGAALSLETLTGGAFPYWLGVTVTSLMVGAIVLYSGFMGTAWGDTFMGLFFAVVLIGTAAYTVSIAGGWDLFRNIEEIRPEALVNGGNPLGMLELWLGVGFGAWVMPHMWQKYYSAGSAEVLGKVAAATPFWNSWMMAVIPLVVGMAVIVPGVAPSVTVATSDTILPQLFAAHAPLVGVFVVAAILAAALSTVNSQLLSSASLVAHDIYGAWSREEVEGARLLKITRAVVVLLTLVVFALAIIPGGTRFLVPIASLGFGFGLQLVPSALGVLHFRGISEKGAFAGLIAGVAVLAAIGLFGLPSPVGAGLSGLIVNAIVTLAVSRTTEKPPAESLRRYHDFFDDYLGDHEPAGVPAAKGGSLEQA